MTLWLACATLILAGTAIGATSIGGVLVVPALTGLAGIPVEKAVAASSLAFMLTGMIGWRGSRHEEASPRILVTLHAAALAGALAGAALVHAVSPDAVHTWIALLTAFSGAWGLTPLRSEHGERQTPPSSAFAVLGLAVGFGSALSGTGGPVLLLPLLMLMRTPVAVSVALSQSIQLPIALAASGVHAMAGALPVALGVGTGIVLVAGACLGRVLARHAPPSTLRVGTSLGLIAVGAWYALQ